MNVLMFILASAGSGQGGGESNPIGLFLPMILIFGIMYLMIFRPQAKKQKAHRTMLQDLAKGDKVVTAGGILGVITGIKEKEDTIVIKVDDAVKIEFTRSSVARKVEKK